jgi:glc operon protein GlcG
MIVLIPLVQLGVRVLNRANMNSKSVFALLSTVFVSAGLWVGMAADRPSDAGVIHLDHEKVAATFAQSGLLLATNNFKVMALRRTGPGEVEIHEHDTDIFYVLEGSATLVTGGKATEPHTTGPGEMRAKNIVGGEDRHLVKGDVMVIPDGVPHWFKEVSGPFLYYMVKVSR